MSEPQNPKTRKPSAEKRTQRATAAPRPAAPIPSGMSEPDLKKFDAAEAERAQGETLTTGTGEGGQVLKGGSEATGGAGYAGEGMRGKEPPINTQPKNSEENPAASDMPAATEESAVPHDWKTGHTPPTPHVAEVPYSPHHHDDSTGWPASGRGLFQGEMVPPGELSVMIAEAAYYRAERRNFHGGYDIEDWLSAEAEIMGRMREIEEASRIGTAGG